MHTVRLKDNHCLGAIKPGQSQLGVNLLWMYWGEGGGNKNPMVAPPIRDSLLPKFLDLWKLLPPGETVSKGKCIPQKYMLYFFYFIVQMVAMDVVPGENYTTPNSLKLNKYMGVSGMHRLFEEQRLKEIKAQTQHVFG